MTLSQMPLPKKLPGTETVERWLPPSEVEQALSEEPRRFVLIFEALRDEWRSSEGTSSATRITRAAEWLEIFET